MTARQLTSTALLVLVTTSLTIAFSSGPPDGVSGAPGDNNCTACHGGNPLNMSGGSMSITAPATFTAGDTIDLTINLARTGQQRWGFEITALDTADAAYGTLLVTSAAMQKSGALPAREYVKHTSAGTFPGTPNASPGWTVRWVSPTGGSTSPVVFYAAGNAANGNGSTSGDFIYTTSTTVQPAVNQPPVLDSIPTPQFVDVGDTLIIPISAIDPDGDSISFSLSQPFVEFTLVDSGNGNGFLIFFTSDSSANGGLFELFLIASDGSLESARFFEVNVNAIPSGDRFIAVDVLSTPGGTTDLDRVAYVTQRPNFGAFDLHLQTRADSIGAERGTRDSVDLISLLPEDVQALTWRRTAGDPQVVLVTSTRPGGSPASRKGGVCICDVGFSGDESPIGGVPVYTDSVWDVSMYGEAASATWLDPSGLAGGGLFVGTRAGYLLQIDLTSTPTLVRAMFAGTPMLLSSVSPLPQVGYVGVLAAANDGTLLLFGPDTLGGTDPIIRLAAMGTINPPIQYFDLADQNPPAPLTSGTDSVSLIGNTGFDANVRKVTLAGDLSGIGSPYLSTVAAGYFNEIILFDRPIAAGSAYLLKGGAGLWLDPGFTVETGKTPFCLLLVNDLIPDSCGYEQCLCVGTRGNVDGNPNDLVDIADLAFLVDHLFILNPALPCPEEANADGMGNIDVADLTFMVDALFINLPPFPPCP